MDVRRILDSGEFNEYSYHFLNYMVTVLYNSHKVGALPTYTWEKSHRFASIGEVIHGMGAKKYRARVLELIPEYVSKLAVEVARLTLTTYDEASKTSGENMRRVRLLLERLNAEEYQDENDKLIEDFWEVYYKELEGKWESKHEKSIKAVILGLEMMYYSRFDPGYEVQIKRYNIT